METLWPNILLFARRVHILRTLSIGYRCNPGDPYCSELKLDLRTHPEQHFVYGGKNFSVKFMATSKKIYEGQEFQCFEFFVDVIELTETQKLGSLHFQLSHEHDDWTSNNNAYQFSQEGGAEIMVTSEKSPDGNLRIAVNGPLGHTLHFTQPIAHIKEKRLFVALTWKDKSVALYINGQPVEEIKVD